MVGLLEKGGVGVKRSLQIILGIVLTSLPAVSQSKIPSTNLRHCSVEQGGSPHYPDSLKGSGIQGTVLIQAIVGEKGCTESVTVIRKLNPKLDEIAIQTVSSWKFSPATKDGKPVRVIVHIPVEFVEFKDAN